MTGRINTAKASPRKKDPELTKPARIRIGQNEHGPVYSEPEVTIGDNRKDEKIKANVQKNAELEAKIAAMQAQFNERAQNYQGKEGQSLMKYVGEKNEGDDRY